MSTPSEPEPTPVVDVTSANRRREARISLWALVIASAFIGFLFYRIVEPFFAPLFFAVVLAVLFRPVHVRIAQWLGGRPRAAAVITVLLLGVGLAALSGVLALAAREMMVTGESFARDGDAAAQLLDRATTLARDYLPGVEWAQVREWISSGVQSSISNIVERTGEFISNAFRVVVGLAITAIAVYYFLAEGSTILRSVRSISPFAAEDEWVLFERFAVISRGVVVGMFVCAFVQAGLLGIGMAIAGVDRLWMLMGLTFLLSMIPFVGAAGVYLPVAVGLMWEGNVTAGILLAIYGMTIVSTSDNLIRALVLHGSAKMHPLLALISALGALQVVGLWGIFLGPVVAAFFYSLLRILRDRLQGQTQPPPVTEVY
ncbi:AI-2E family transporter [Aeoliella sp. SH292]|uniref:AI-2E family transporter n=1 Tax=Aeoliella sp. SH292 TaxID=3454464 RepID=UPI003F96FEAF